MNHSMFWTLSVWSSVVAVHKCLDPNNDEVMSVQISVEPAHLFSNE